MTSFLNWKCPLIEQMILWMPNFGLFLLFLRIISLLEAIIVAKNAFFKAHEIERSKLKSKFKNLGQKICILTMCIRNYSTWTLRVRSVKEFWWRKFFCGWQKTHPMNYGFFDKKWTHNRVYMRFFLAYIALTAALHIIKVLEKHST